MTDPASDVYHDGEIAVQRRAGVRERAEKMSGMVGETVPSDDDVRELVADQPPSSSRPWTGTATCGFRF